MMLDRNCVWSSDNIISRCDFSFGSLAAYNEISVHDTKFIDKYKSLLSSQRDYMTLFIDNTRLYRKNYTHYNAMERPEMWRELQGETPYLQTIFSNRIRKDELMLQTHDQDLLQLCSKLCDMKFIIFSGYDDTPLCSEVFDRIPDNVLRIYAANSQYFGGKITPIIFGLQKMDSRYDCLIDMINSDLVPQKLLYLNQSLRCNPNRAFIRDMFVNKDWVTYDTPTGITNQEYNNFLIGIKKHKFVICPDGNALGCDCFRNTEVIYMRRVPIVIESELFKILYKDIPVLMVKDFSEVTEQLLFENEHLFQKAQQMSFDNLNLEIMFNKMIDFAKK